MKTLAFYLPQFHRIPENDAWWGNGFTEWTAVRGAKPLFAGHEQPREPLGSRYYNLLDKNTMAWQATLAHEYGLDGFVFYHYWFQDGRKILEKPVENLLGWHDIDMPFCFDWANESWTRTWSRFQPSNVWSEDGKQWRGRQRVLLQQGYGDRSAWEQHFDYLLPFFLDCRYIKKDNRPVLLIYWPGDIGCLTEMKECWEERAQEAGFDGVYLIGETKDAYQALYPPLDALLVRVPDYGLVRALPPTYLDGVATYDYADCWHSSLWHDYPTETRVYYSGCLAYDTTPRRAGNGVVLTGCSPDVFRNLLTELFQISCERGNEFAFLNAWNECGEGAYLEPDERHGYDYLRALRDAKHQVQSRSADGTQQAARLELLRRSHRFYAMQLRESLQMQDIFHYWLIAELYGRHLTDALAEKGWQTLAVYGYGLLGQYLVREICKESRLQLLGIVDRQADSLQADGSLYADVNHLPAVDAIIVTPAVAGADIKRQVQKVRQERVCTLEEILRELAQAIERS